MLSAALVISVTTISVTPLTHQENSDLKSAFHSLAKICIFHKIDTLFEMR